MQTKEDRGVRQGDALEFVNNMLEFYRIAFQKVSACRNIIKEVFYTDAGTGGRGNGLLIYYFGCFDLDTSAQFIFMFLRFEFYLGDGSNRSHGFAPKTHGTDGKEIFCPLYF